LLLHLDVSPLPAWTTDVLTFLLQFTTMFLATWWVMNRRAADWKQAVLVFLTLVIFGILLELALAIKLEGPSADLFTNLISVPSLVLYLVYAIGVSCGYLQAERHSATPTQSS
jgi:antibiotic biosynthesis monooxygenase (ABM) superfamily enzyme